MTKPPRIRAAAAFSVISMGLGGAPAAAADPVGPPPIPPPGASVGPPGFAPGYRVGAPPVFANTHGPTDARGVRVNSNADAAESGVGLPDSVLGNSPAPNQNLAPNHGVGVFGGFEAAPGAANGGGIQPGTNEPHLEDPHGRPLQDRPSNDQIPLTPPPSAYG
jgi:hypothetical protein